MKEASWLIAKLNIKKETLIKIKKIKLVEVGENRRKKKKKKGQTEKLKGMELESFE